MNYNGYSKGKRVLVTGGAGFLGSFLCERLLESGAEVLCVDNYFAGRRANIAHLFANLPAVQDEPKQRQPDIVLANKHLGWTPTVGLMEGLERTVSYFRQIVSSQAR